MSHDITNTPESFKRCLPSNSCGKIQPAMAFCDASEKELHQQFRSWCNVNGIICVSSRMDKKSGLGNGVWDFTCIRGGYGCAVEFKVAPNKLSEDQIEYQKLLAACLVPSLCAYSLAEAIQFVKQHLLKTETKK